MGMRGVRGVKGLSKRCATEWFQIGRGGVGEAGWLWQRPSQSLMQLSLRRAIAVCVHVDGSSDGDDYHSRKYSRHH